MIEVAWRSVPRVGELESGDAVVVREEGDARLLVLIDALGHGASAARVAHQAVTSLAECHLQSDPITIMSTLHEVLRGTRGAAVTVLRLQALEVEGCMVGNVDVRTVGARLPALALSGVVGIRLPKLRSFRGALAPGARVFVHSDGISRRAPFDRLAALGAAQACEEALASHRHEHDDSSIIAIYAARELESDSPPRIR